ncbi:hypothetical protein MJO28_011333 [Puccinia striiformis f. sp. tritici]|uniref:3-hydroxyacyl-CoA dehydrogenase n=3 Tax=Puccinia striiformis TaxID=27350 RepID=A0A0L0UP39_9BASI|nr:hypothetical protein Pst134EA_021016 [Puccinia striiformis f. sp. tritici]KNE88862.1 hypothetical protein PSTG_17692 [Puccinia striiformis f. sp. tritici PST-78]POW10200.1 hypothetical protein PSTT_06228 [Puccinia striiformis]KAH9457121.1 hypothetical protein Pst134EA_021016 [Puccinia striiformis f. sp. tritici]KAI7943805.1 hypothetical protein MJO28_011333 [Puccinia striiformis f. sp. tritici]KAI7946587.1 hypothetical protein MJO29_011114 [Puccinia striiformis f. sp. tritici]
MLLVRARLASKSNHFRTIYSPFSSTPTHHVSTPSASASGDEVKHLTVIGAGLMGSGIAQVAAQAGISVTIHGMNQEICQESESIINQSLKRIAKKKFQDQEPNKAQEFIESINHNLKFVTDLRDSIHRNKTNLIIEAIVEKIEIKQELFKTLDGLIDNPDTIFTSNTSSLKISEISQTVSTQRKKLFAGLHFFNPVPQMKLVEVIKTDHTSNETIQRLINFSKQLGKSPVTCTDTPGFIVNRLLVPYLLEAMRMIERGEATKEDIDTAMKLGAGHPMGPIELSDYVGLDTMKFISDGWRDTRVQSGEIDAALVKPVQSLDQLVKDGKLGRKSKQGFLKY